jgi:hypothetical protein
VPFPPLCRPILLPFIVGRVPFLLVSSIVAERWAFHVHIPCVRSPYQGNLGRFGTAGKPPLRSKYYTMAWSGDEKARGAYKAGVALSILPCTLFPSFIPSFTFHGWLPFFNIHPICRLPHNRRSRRPYPAADFTQLPLTTFHSVLFSFSRSR